MPRRGIYSPSGICASPGRPGREASPAAHIWMPQSGIQMQVTALFTDRKMSPPLRTNHIIDFIENEWIL